MLLIKKVLMVLAGMVVVILAAFALNVIPWPSGDKTGDAGASKNTEVGALTDEALKLDMYYSPACNC